MNGPHRILLNSASARHGLNGGTGSNVVPIPRTHSDLVKFDRDDGVYDRVLRRLQDLADSPNCTALPVRGLTTREQGSFPDRDVLL